MSNQQAHKSPQSLGQCLMQCQAMDSKATATVELAGSGSAGALGGGMVGGATSAHMRGGQGHGGGAMDGGLAMSSQLLVNTNLKGAGCVADCVEAQLHGAEQKFIQAVGQMGKHTAHPHAMGSGGRGTGSGMPM